MDPFMKFLMLIAIFVISKQEKLMDGPLKQCSLYNKPVQSQINSL